MGRMPFIRFASDQWSPVLELEKQDISYQTVLIVGAGAGLGLEAAKHIARMRPAKLLVACRSLKKGEDAAKCMTPAFTFLCWVNTECYAAIEESTGFNKIAVYAVDLSIFSSVNDFVEEIKKKEDQLHTLVYNAGIATHKYQPTVDGLEET